MAILFDWYELPETKDKQREEKILHPRIRLNGSTTTDELRRRIQERSSLTETDVSAVLDADVYKRQDVSNGLNEFSTHLNYYKYYNVTAIKLAEDKDILTNLNNSETFVPVSYTHLWIAESKV